MKTQRSISKRVPNRARSAGSHERLVSRLSSLSLFLTELKCSGRITWSFDEQQADPIHKFWPDMVADWQKAISDVSANKDSATSKS